jgi:hypothetical protein
MEYCRKTKARKSMKQKAGDGDRTRDVQLGKMPDVYLSKTSVFNTFIGTYRITPYFTFSPVFVA